MSCIKKIITLKFTYLYIYIQNVTVSQYTKELNNIQTHKKSVSSLCQLS